MIKACLFACLIAVACATEYPPAPSASYLYKQTLDHFNVQASADITFDQRVLISDAHYNHKKDAPLFFYTGNEGTIYQFYNNTGAMWELAEQFGALIIFVEHRYYGESLPFGPDKSFDHGKVGFLSPEQALADYATFLVDFKQRNTEFAGSPVVTFGGSYGGTLSAWMRVRYPNVVDFSLAASAPILLYDGITPSTEFYRLVTNDFDQALPNCRDSVTGAFNQLSSMAQEKHYAEIASTLKLCNAPKNESDIDFLNQWIRNAFVNLAMGDYPYATTFLGPLPANPVNVSCATLAATASSLTPLARLVAHQGPVDLYYNNTGALQCHDVSVEFFPCSDSTGCGAPTDSNSRAWDYQACTEILHNIGTNGVTDMFPADMWSLPRLTEYCQAKWQVTPRPHWCPLNFDVSHSSYIMFSWGSVDPWTAGCVKSSLSDTLISIPVPGGAHHLDLRFSNPHDPPAVTQARKTERDTLAKWLAQYYDQSQN